MMPPALEATLGLRVVAWQERRWAWPFVLACSILLLFLPALWNGFPFLFYDSGAFIDLAFRGGFIPARSAFYAFFLAAFGAGYSLWLAMAVQVAMVVLVMAEFVRAVRPGLSPLWFLSTVVVLAVATDLPWCAAEVLPDILAPLLVLCLYLLGFRSDALSIQRKAALLTVAVLAATSHASHLGLAAGLALATGLAQLLARRRALPAAVSPRWRLPALVVVLSLSLVLANNYVRTGDVYVSRAGPGFVLARLLQDGIAQQVLDDTCPEAGYRLCAYKGSLPRDSNDFLWQWNSPFSTLGGFRGMEREARSIVWESLRRYPLWNLKAAVADTAEQFVTFRSGDGVEQLDNVPLPAMKRNIPDQVRAHLASRQHTGEIHLRWMNDFQLPIAALSIIGLAAIFVQAAARRQWSDRLFLPAFVLLALLGNAFICGALSSPHDRYQARLVWMASFVLLLLVAPKREDAGTPSAG